MNAVGSREAIPRPANLRDAWAAGRSALPGVFCPWLRRMAERIGFRGGVSLRWGARRLGNGVPDIGLLTLTEFVDEARHIVAATALPLVCDADTGFGEALNVERTVQLFEAAGVAGIHLEDQQFPKRCGHLSGKSLVDAEVMAAKTAGGGRGAAGCRFRHHRADRRPRRDRLRGRRAPGAAVCRSGDGCHFPRRAGVGGRVRALRARSAGATAGEHDGVRPQPAAGRYHAGGDGLPPDPVSR